MAKSTFIWGSCVTRDIIRVTNRFELAGYVGRQSLVSGMNPGVKDPGPTGLSSGFQDRSLRGDIRSNGKQVITDKAVDADAFIVDLATERRGVYPVRDGFLSRTQELQKSGLLPKYDHGAVIEFGSEQHQELFATAAQELKSHLSALGIANRVGVINHPFAGEDEIGLPAPPSIGMSAQEWNRLFPAYYKILSDVGFTVFNPPPPRLVVTTEDHAWGEAVDHYIDETYFFWADQIEDFIAGLA